MASIPEVTIKRNKVTAKDPNVAVSNSANNINQTINAPRKRGRPPGNKNDTTVKDPLQLGKSQQPPLLKNPEIAPGKIPSSRIPIRVTLPVL
jgi:hypothetical protein